MLWPCSCYFFQTGDEAVSAVIVFAFRVSSELRVVYLNRALSKRLFFCGAQPQGVACGVVCCPTFVLFQYKPSLQLQVLQVSNKLEEEIKYPLRHFTFPLPTAKGEGIRASTP